MQEVEKEIIKLCGTGSRYAYLGKYTDVTMKNNGGGGFVYSLAGPSTRSVRNLFMQNLSKTLNDEVKDVRFFVISGDRTASINGKDSANKTIRRDIKSGAGLLFGVEDDDLKRIYQKFRLGFLLTNYKNQNNITGNVPRQVRTQAIQQSEEESQNLDRVYEFINRDIEELWKRCKPKVLIIVGKKSDADKGLKFKPSDIGIAGKKVTASVLIQKTYDYVESQEPGLLPLFREMFDELDKKKSTQIESIVEFGSEALEVFSAYYLLKELPRNRSLKTKFGITTDVVTPTKWTVKFPTESSYPLVDYFVYPPDSDVGIQVSVKNASFGVTPNTVKPKTLFKNVSDIDKWKKSHPQDQDQEYMAFRGGVMMKAPAGKTNTMYPLLSVNMFARKDRQTIKQFIIQYLSSINTEVGSMSTSAIADYIINFINDNKKIKVSQSSLKDPITDPTMRLILQNSVLKRSKSSDTNVMALSFLCEKTLELASQKGKQMNFKKMFEEKAIFEKQVIYCTAKDRKVGSQTRIFFVLQGKYNWSKFKGDWMSLRSKNSAGSFSDALGIDPRLF